MINSDRIVFLSNWFDNPYKKSLTSCLQKRGFTVSDYLWKYFFLPQVITPQIPDIVHLHTLHPFLIGKNFISRGLKLVLFISQVFILNLLGGKVIWTVHEWKNKLKPNDNITPFQGRVIGYFFHGIITHCETTKQEIIQAFSLKNTSKVVVIPHGNYVDWYENKVSKEEAREKLGIGLNKNVFALFGNIYRYKGVLEAIDSFLKLPPEKSFLIIAGKVESQELEAEIKAKIAGCENILFLPQRIPDEEVQIYLNAADWVVFPYTVFTTSGVAILAMSFSCACIAPKVGFFHDVLDESGAILYESGNEEGLLQAMESALVKSHEVKSMGKYNFQLVNKWSWDYVTDETLKAYK